MPLSALYDARVYVGEAKGLRWEERGIPSGDNKAFGREGAAGGNKKRAK